MPGWIQDPVTRQLIPREEYRQRGKQVHYIQPDIEPFVSPVDGKLISSHTQLREHNKVHNVTNTREYGDGYFERKEKERIEEFKGNTRSAKKSRIDSLVRAYELNDRS